MVSKLLPLTLAGISPANRNAQPDQERHPHPNSPPGSGREANSLSLEGEGWREGDIYYQ
jgi:hypothetical protein